MSRRGSLFYKVELDIIKTDNGRTPLQVLFESENNYKETPTLSLFQAGYTDIVNDKDRLGDLEIDLVIGKDHKGALLTINDRATGLLFMGKIDAKESAAVEAKTFELLEQWKPLLHTITSDNGKEFANHQQLSQKLEIDYFFSKPYHSWKRGANENLNRLVRQYFPKKKPTLH